MGVGRVGLGARRGVHGGRQRRATYVLHVQWCCAPGGNCSVSAVQSPPLAWAAVRRMTLESTTSGNPACARGCASGAARHVVVADASWTSRWEIEPVHAAALCCASTAPGQPPAARLTEEGGRCGGRGVAQGGRGVGVDERGVRHVLVLRGGAVLRQDHLGVHRGGAVGGIDGIGGLLGGRGHGGGLGGRGGEELGGQGAGGLRV